MRISGLEDPMTARNHEIHHIIATQVMEIAHVLPWDHVEITNQQNAVPVSLPLIGDKPADHFRLLVPDILFSSIPPRF